MNSHGPSTSPKKGAAGVPVEPKGTPKCHFHVRAGSITFSPDSVHCVDATWLWATSHMGECWGVCPATGVTGAQANGRGKSQESQSEFPLFRSLNIQVLYLTCSGHAYSGQLPVPKCDWWESTFLYHWDLTGHVSKLPLSSTFSQWSVGNRLGAYEISKAV